jgi:ribonuclease R
VIHSAARLTYTEVADILGNTKGRKRRAAADRAAPAEPVRRVQALLKARGARRDRFRNHRNLHRLQPERQDREDHSAHPQRCAPPDRRVHADGQRLRGRSADPPQASGHLPHPRQPTLEKLKQVRTFLKQVGLNLGGGDKPAAADYAELMRRSRSVPTSLLQTMLLRSMQQAVYSLTTSATSAWPTRRMPTSPARSAAIRTC